jgi:hypothetical protein
MKREMLALPYAFLTLSVCCQLEACEPAPSDSKTVVSDLNLPPAVTAARLKGEQAFVIAAPGQTYYADPVRRFLFGDLHRDLWRIPFRVEVLRLDTFAGGLQVQKVTGGKQTLGLRFVAKDEDVVYQFRSIVKDPRRAVPKILYWAPFGPALNDQMAAQFPLAPMVVAELVEAVDVLVSKPRVVVMPDDPRLGEYRHAFAGRMGWIERRPEEGKDNRPGFAGSTDITDTYTVFNELAENPRHYVNSRSLLRARLVDFLVGDWDRHSDQWRWAKFDDGERVRWEPIPRDRDWAFAHIDGVFTKLVRLTLPQYVGFSDEYPEVSHLVWASKRLDRSLLADIEREEFLRIAAEVSSRLNDSVLRQSTMVLPAEYREVGVSLFDAMKSRRNDLMKIAADFYEYLARDVRIHGTLRGDSATITCSDGSVRVQLHSTGAHTDIGTEHEWEGGTAAERLLFFDRTFRAGETRHLLLELLDGSDRIVIEGSADAPIKVRIATAGKDDSITDRTRGRNVTFVSVPMADIKGGE